MEKITENNINVWKSTIEDISITDIIKYSYNLQKENLGEYNKISSVNGFQSYEIKNIDNLALIDMFFKITEIINNECIVDLNITRLKVFEYWININSKGSYNRKHTHVLPPEQLHYEFRPQSLISGVFYVNVPSDKSGNINFYFNDNKITITPKTNDLVIFPSDLYHSVEINEDDGDRISIAFNYVKINHRETNKIL